MIQTPHPVLPTIPEAELQRLVQTEGVDATLARIQARERLLATAEADPFHTDALLEPAAYRLVDEQLHDPRVTLVALFGGNRNGKSWLGAKRQMHAAAEHQGVYIALSEKKETSIAQQQRILWHYLPAEWKALNSPRAGAGVAINFTEKNGFTDGHVVLPSPALGTRAGSHLYALTYQQDPDDYEGWEFGAEDGAQVVAAWADESMPLAWLQMLERRLRYRKGAKLLWTFTPVRGLTPAMKEFIGAAPRYLQGQLADLLPNAQIPGLPQGYMPTLAIPFMPKGRVVWWHVGTNPFGNYTAAVRELCQGKTTEFIERVAYGFARDTGARLFPSFGPVHLVEPSEVPKVGTNYMICDPAETRPWFCLWVRVTPGNPPTYYVYRDFPSAQVWGEWATPTERETSADSTKGWDGDVGPAQETLGWGPAEYWSEWLKLEEGEEVYERYFDPRAAGSGQQQKEGSRTLLELIEETAPASEAQKCRPAPGLDELHGLAAIKSLLAWDESQPVVSGLNAPHLFISRACEQLIWALGNYTGKSGQKGACRDPIDALRYLATAELWHVDPAQPVGRKARGIY